MPNLTSFSEAPSLVDLGPEEGDSNMTTASAATVSSVAPKGKRKAGTARKAATGSKGRKTKTKKDELVVEVPAVEPEDDDFEIKVVTNPPRIVRGRKRASDDMSVDEQPAQKKRQSSLQPPKRRATRTRATKVNDQEHSALDYRHEVSSPITAHIENGLEVSNTTPPQGKVAVTSPPKLAEQNLISSQQHEVGFHVEVLTCVACH